MNFRFVERPAHLSGLQLMDETFPTFVAEASKNMKLPASARFEGV
jgi:hypothetical protein